MPKYEPGDRVTVRAETPDGHHRTPGYVKGKIGRVKAICGVFPNPESLAYGGSGQPWVPLYRIEFDQTEIWTSYAGPATDKLMVDIYEHWLMPTSPDRMPNPHPERAER